MNYIFLLIILLVLCASLAVGIVIFINSLRIKKMCENAYFRGKIEASREKIIELPLRKEKYPLYVFKNGEKQKFRLKKPNRR